MSSPSIDSDDIDEELLRKWQGIADLVAGILRVPAALIMRTDGECMEVLVSSRTEGNPYRPGDREKWEGLYCETVVKTRNELLIPDATADPHWKDNPDRKLGMIAYLGLPVNFPDGRPFGTLCVLDNQPNSFTPLHQELLRQLRDTIESDIALGQHMLERVQHAEALRESEERFRLLADELPALICEFLPDSTLLFVNKAYCECFDMAKEHLLGVRFLDYLPENERESLRAAHTSLTPQNAVLRRLHRVIRKDTVQWHEWHNRAVFDSSGTLLKYIAIGQDVTQEHLRREELRIKDRALETSTNAVAFADLAGKLSYVNPAFLRYWGYEHAAEVLGRHAAEFCLSPGKPEALAQALQSKGSWQGELTAKRRDGSTFDVAVSACMVTDERGQAISMQAALEDITERKRAEEALRFQAMVLDQITDRVTVTDLEGRITYVNEAEVHTLGYRRDELIGESTEKYGEDPARGATQREIVDQTLRHGTWRGEVVNHTADGRELTLDCRTRVVHDREGNPVALCGIATDITERKRVEDALRAAKVAAEAAAAAKGRFLANMSHEIRTPINGVLPFARMLSDTYLTEEQKLYVSTIESSCKSLLHVINQILDYSRIEAGKTDIRKSDFDVRKLVGEVVAMMEPQARGKKIDIRCEFGPHVPQWVQGDAGHLSQILINLAGNAVKFTEQGEVVVKVAGERIKDAGARRKVERGTPNKKEQRTGNEEQIATSDAQGGDNEEIPGFRCQVLSLIPSGNSVLLHFSVADTGIGIPPNKVSHLFESFMQVDDSHTRRYGGTGLGLAISRELARMMGGDIALTTSLGQGSTFTLTLPFGISEQPQACPSPSSASTHAGFPQYSVRILVAEDDPANQLAARLMLRKFGAEVDVVEDGVQALQALAEKNYDLILMDIQMPVMDGMEAVREIRRREAGEESPQSGEKQGANNGRHPVPIIAMTAHAMQGDRERFIAAGMDDYMLKPLETDQLRDVLGRCLPD